MRITSIIENTSTQGLPTEHGLSLYIEKDDGQKVLFDMGQSTLFSRNAETLELQIADVDIAVVSHGHYDHGGGLSTFLKENQSAKVFIHADAFQPHYSLRETGLRYIGLDTSLKDSNRIVFCHNVTNIDAGMMLFSNVQGNCCTPVGNRLLFGPSEDENDSFCHEQSLIIEENSNVVLFAGCAHRGIVNIMRKAIEVYGKTPTHVFAGMHLVKAVRKRGQSDDCSDHNIQERTRALLDGGLDEAGEDAFIASLASELKKYGNTKFYTMHCTGEEQYQKLKALMGEQIEYLSCGDSAFILSEMRGVDIEY